MAQVWLPRRWGRRSTTFVPRSSVARSSRRMALLVGIERRIPGQAISEWGIEISSSETGAAWRRPRRRTMRLIWQAILNKGLNDSPRRREGHCLRPRTGAGAAFPAPNATGITRTARNRRGKGMARRREARRATGEREGMRKRICPYRRISPSTGHSMSAGRQAVRGAAGCLLAALSSPPGEWKAHGTVLVLGRPAMATTPAPELVSSNIERQWESALALPAGVEARVLDDLPAAPATRRTARQALPCEWREHDARNEYPGEEQNPGMFH